jgi:hypothetical protein
MIKTSWEIEFMFMVGNQGLRGIFLSLWLLRHWIILEEEEKLMIGVRKDFFYGEEHLYYIVFCIFFCFQFHIIFIYF